MRIRGKKRKSEGKIRRKIYVKIKTRKDGGDEGKENLMEDKEKFENFTVMGEKPMEKGIVKRECQNKECGEGGEKEGAGGGR